jgi:hypothetical protein
MFAWRATRALISNAVVFGAASRAGRFDFRFAGMS